MTDELIGRLRRKLRRDGACRTAVLPVERLHFSVEYRSMCEVNVCGMYGKCWMCPPDVGTAAALVAQARSYRTAVVYEVVSPIAGASDTAGMLEAGRRQNLLAKTAQDYLRARTDEPFLQLAAGGCRLCEPCARTAGQPCRFPGEAVASLEAYCVDVARMADACGMRYFNGPNTVAYFGTLLVR